MSKLTLTSLKKQLSQKTKEDLVKEIAMRYKTFTPVKEYYQSHFLSLVRHSTISKS